MRSPFWIYIFHELFAALSLLSDETCVLGVHTAPLHPPSMQAAPWRGGSRYLTCPLKSTERPP